MSSLEKTELEQEIRKQEVILKILEMNIDNTSYNLNKKELKRKKEKIIQEINKLQQMM